MIWRLRVPIVWLFYTLLIWLFTHWDFGACMFGGFILVFCYETIWRELNRR
jgi:hypothetical protein